MDIATILAFVAAALVVLAIPGPTILPVCADAMSVGKRAAALARGPA